jgi:hypothetical protein
VEAYLYGFWTSSLVKEAPTKSKALQNQEVLNRFHWHADCSYVSRKYVVLVLTEGSLSAREASEARADMHLRRISLSYLLPGLKYLNDD